MAQEILTWFQVTGNLQEQNEVDCTFREMNLLLETHFLVAEVNIAE
jgi:hypothetical protein